MTRPGAIEIESSSFTEHFVEQLGHTISIIPSHQAGGTSSEGLVTLLRPQVDVNASSIGRVLDCLTQMRLISEINGQVGRSRRGDKLRRDVRNQGYYPLAVAIIRSGFMADQIRAIREVITSAQYGYRCGRSSAQRVAPQLVGLLRRMPDVVVTGYVDIGTDAGLELDSVWNELPPASHFSWKDAEKNRKALGDRAELYSLQLERSSHVGARENIIWVSQDDDGLGYDIEVRGVDIRRIEVKGSSRKDVQFFLSSNEFRVACLHRASYEIHFWGDIRMQSDPIEDYERLRSAGYPVRIVDPTITLGSSPWIIEPSQYRITKNTLLRYQRVGRLSRLGPLSSELGDQAEVVG